MNKIARYRYYNWYTPTEPISVKDGIKLKSRKGNIGDTWWSQCWVDALESFGWSNRLQRGRNYARRGQVIDFDIKKGKIIANVQGSIRKPYEVSISLNMFNDDEWEKILDELTNKAIFSAFLLNGEIPHDIDTIFNKLKLSLLPKSSNELSTYCSCPDIANPCKHIAAVHYVLAEKFDMDPFFIFKLRGRDKDEIINALRERRSRLIKKRKSYHDTKTKKNEKKTVINVSNISLSNFWGSKKSFSKIYIEISPPKIPDATLKLVGNLPISNSRGYMSILKKYYRIISKNAIKYAYQ